MSNVKVTDVTVSTKRIFCRVKVEGSLYSSKQIKNKILELRPTLKKHKCKNELGEQFVDAIDSTSIPHLLEHLIIDFQVQYLTECDLNVKPIFGTTEWLDQEQGIAKISVSFMDDVVALKAIKDAASLLDSILQKFSC